MGENKSGPFYSDVNGRWSGLLVFGNTKRPQNVFRQAPLISCLPLENFISKLHSTHNQQILTIKQVGEFENRVLTPPPSLHLEWLLKRVSTCRYICTLAATKTSEIDRNSVSTIGDRRTSVIVLCSTTVAEKQCCIVMGKPRFCITVPIYNNTRSPYTYNGFISPKCLYRISLCADSTMNQRHDKMRLYSFLRSSHTKCTSRSTVFSRVKCWQEQRASAKY